MVSVPTDDFLLDLIQTDPESKAEDEVLKKYCEDANGREKYKKLERVLNGVV